MVKKSSMNGPYYTTHHHSKTLINQDVYILLITFSVTPGCWYHCW